MNGLKKYKQKVDDMLPSTAEERKFILAEVETSLGQGCESLSYEAIVERLGPPEEIAAASIENMNPEDIALAIRKRRRFIRLATILVAGFLLIWMTVVTVIVINSMGQSGGHLFIYPPDIIESIIYD